MSDKRITPEAATWLQDLDGAVKRFVHALADCIDAELADEKGLVDAGLAQRMAMAQEELAMRVDSVVVGDSDARYSALRRAARAHILHGTYGDEQ